MKPLLINYSLLLYCNYIYTVKPQNEYNTTFSVNYFNIIYNNRNSYSYLETIYG